MTKGAELPIEELIHKVDVGGYLRGQRAKREKAPCFGIGDLQYKRDSHVISKEVLQAFPMAMSEHLRPF